MAIGEIAQIEKRQTVVEAIAQELIRYIAANGLTGGDRLPSERDMAKMVGASRLPLREALCVLKGLGIVEAQHGKGVFVKHLDLAAVFGMLSPLLRSQADINMDHLFQARLHLEGSVVELAAANRDEENLRLLEDAVDRMRENLANREAYIRYDMVFHQQLANSTGNPIFKVFMSSITDLLAELQFRYKDSVEIRGAAIIEHEEILDAVAAGDGSQARAAMENHLHNAVGRIC